MKRSNGKGPNSQVRLLTSISEKLGHLVEVTGRLVAGQERLVAITDRLVATTERLEEGQKQLAKRIDNMLEFIGEHWREQGRRLDSVEARLAKAGI
jgi:hypothetical protein